MTTAERRSLEADGWVPVHPTEGPDWPAFTMDEADTSRFLVSGYEWQECRVLLAADAPASPRDDFSPENDPFPEDAPASGGECAEMAKRLRDYVVTGHNPDGPPSIKFHPRLCDDAAALIERLSPASGGEWRQREAFDAFSKATSLPGGPSLEMQRHDPTWQAWKALCDSFSAPAPPSSPVPSVTLTDGEVNTLQAAVENLRGGGTDPDAKFRIAYNLEQIAKRASMIRGERRD